MFICDILNLANVCIFLTNPKYVLSITAKMHVKFHCGKPLQCCRANQIVKEQYVL